MNETEERVQVQRRQADTAVQLAMANRWKEAVDVNRSIITLYPNDADSYNRLGKAFMELGRFKEAKKAYKKGLALEPANRIARKNLDRLTVLTKAGDVEAETTHVDPSLFIEEMGKSAVTLLQETAAKTLPRLNAGDRVELRAHGGALAVETPSGEFIGSVEAKLGRRLIKLMEGGNEYAAAVTSLGKEECRVIIKETHQDPSQAGRPSFPTAVPAEGTRAYTKEKLVRRGPAAEGKVAEVDEAGGAEDGGDKDAWDDETETQEGDVRLNEAAAAEDVDEEELEE